MHVALAFVFTVLAKTGVGFVLDKAFANGGNVRWVSPISPVADASGGNSDRLKSVVIFLITPAMAADESFFAAAHAVSLSA
jgi:hypothetical protein